MSPVGARHIRPLTDLRRADEGLFGGKSASLGELLAAGIPVPPGFALASTAFERFLEQADLGAGIAQELSGLDPEDLDTLRSASAAIGDAVGGAPLPDEVRAELAEAYEELASGEASVAVRSSALGEDSHEATFAGQQETYLWVQGLDHVCEAVRDCWASLYSPEAISYRARQVSAGGGGGGGADPAAGAASPAPAMGVAVQAMVDASVSGVMFTCNPVNGDPSTVAINASWGLGLAVVGGEVTPDEYRLSKVTRELLSRSVSSKDVEYLPDPSGGGTVRTEVAAERRERACLDDEELELLLEVGRRVERHFGSPQDIEWALAREGSLPESLFVLQSRPVTTAPRKAEPVKPQSALSLVMQTFGAAKGDDRDP